MADDTVTREDMTQQALCHLVRLRELREDWDSYGAHPITDAAAKALPKVLDILVKDDGPTPQLCPMVDGGVGVEWLVNGDYLSVECTSEGRLSFYGEISHQEQWEANDVKVANAAEHFDRAAAMLADMAPFVRFRPPAVSSNA